MWERFLGTFRERAARLGEPGARLLAQGVVGEPSDVLAELERLAGVGCEIAYLHLYDLDDLDQVRLLGREVVPAAAELSAGLPTST